MRFNSFSARSNHDNFYNKEIEIEKDIFNINGDEICFFIENRYKGLLGEHFILLWIKDAFEGQVTLYLICFRKKPSNRPANVLDPE